MYKLVLCWRYLLTRYLALLCIVSVMLGVATLIVVNAVMSGFSTKLKDRLHGLLSDVSVEAVSFEGFADPAEKMRRVQASPAGPLVKAMAPSVEVFAMVQYRWGVGGDVMTRPVRLVGIDPEKRAGLGGYAEYLMDPAQREKPSFELTGEVARRQEWLHPKGGPAVNAEAPPAILAPGQIPEPDAPPVSDKTARGIVLGAGIASFRNRQGPGDVGGRDTWLLKPGDDVQIFTVGAQRMEPVFDRFAVVDFFKSEMSEYDGHFVFVPLDYLQHLRTMGDKVSAIQIRLTDASKAREVRDCLRALFPPDRYLVQTWEDKQGPLLAAISVERGILNVLLFLIVGVAGFGILSIFSMIVMEKTRDIGILKALGASNGGVMSIFIGYGLLLGLVGSGLGTVAGLAITDNINEIEKVLTHITGAEVFPRDVYYFDKIPTDVQPWTVACVNLGAIGIAVLFSVIPAIRAATLHPVQALRYE